MTKLADEATAPDAMTRLMNSRRETRLASVDPASVLRSAHGAPRRNPREAYTVAEHQSKWRDIRDGEHRRDWSTERQRTHVTR